MAELTTLNGMTIANSAIALDEQLTGTPVANTGWDDLKFPAERSKKIADKEPKETAYKGGVILEFEYKASDTSGIVFNGQMPHAYKDGTDLEAHMHLVLPVTTPATEEYVRFEMTYSWAEIGGVFPAEITIANEFNVASITADMHFVVGLHDLIDDTKSILSANKAAATADVSSMILCSLVRTQVTGVGHNEYEDSIYLLETDFHYQIDQERGSRMEFEK